MSDRDALLAILRERSVRYGSFVLASGETSDIYVDVRLTTMCARAMPLVGRAILERIEARGWRPRAVGGLTLGADPVAYAAARESLEGSPIDAFTIRKEAKGHGRKRRVEGIEEPSGLAVVILDDVCTTGGSTLQAIEAARDAGMQVLGAVCLVDREQGASEALAAVACPLERVFTLSEVRERGSAS